MKCLPSTVTTHFSSRISGIENTGAGVRLTVSRQGQSESQIGERWTFEATIAIGCDGIKSEIRNTLNLPGGRVRYTGTYAYRSLIKMEDAVAQLGKSVQEPFMWMGHQKVCLQKLIYTHDQEILDLLILFE
jgi:salicylate hydroxylase